MLQLNKLDLNFIKIKEYVDNNLVDKLLNIYNELINYLPEERKLIHGDFGNNNIMVSNNNFSGVIDWDCAAYGDPISTVGIAYFWSKHLMCADKVWNYWKEIYKDTPNFNERICIYAIRCGIEDIYENVLEDDIVMVNWLQNRCREILDLYLEKIKVSVR